MRTWWEAAGCAKALVVDLPPTAGATEAAQVYRPLHAVMERARRDGLIRENPATILGAGSVATLERTPASVAELRIAAGAMPARYRAAMWVAALTSVRSGELFALRRRDWDAKRRTLSIERAVELEAAADSFGQVKASASLRTVVVPKLAAAALVEHLEKFTANAPGSLIFTTSTGGIIYPGRIGRHWTRARGGRSRRPPVARPTPHRAEHRSRCRCWHQGAAGSGGALHDDSRRPLPPQRPGQRPAGGGGDG
ncbi:MAG: hypothetical protein HHJ14_07855 [Cellulomonas sp.]|uniref:hypothetical protein n=1 Tax=Cellulomonas sp. TaxID=40001 RepID=UPI0017A361D8|nr:hypothetical protein [Cellulomonas sp.]NMM17044.1 hypothetical protein [Cellulomonas sp.]NMM31757.1 hypothetical protein [Cellulomonas sp.]